MLLDAQALFSDDQAITASAASTNYMDLGAPKTAPLAPAALVRDIGGSNDMEILIQVTADFATLTSLTVAVQTDDNTSFSSATTVHQTAAIPAASLLEGYKFKISNVPIGTSERYLRLYYTVAGSNATAGTITAGIVDGIQTNG